MRPACSTWALLACCSIGMCVPATTAQEEDRVQVRKTGVLKGLRGPVLQMEAEDGSALLVKLPERQENILMDGVADSSWLRPGMLVQFRATLNRRGQAVEPVRELLVFTPRAESKLGVFPEAAGGAAGDLFSNDQEKAVRKPRPSNDPVPCLVSGPLRQMRRNRIAVLGGNLVVEAELAEGAKITLDLADLAPASPGDSVTVEGWAYAQQPNQVYAQRLSVTAAQPLTMDPKILKQRAKAAKEAPSAIKSADPPDPEKTEKE